jgi:hypothetical protein
MFIGPFPTDARGVLSRGIMCLSGENLMDIGFILPGSWIYSKYVYPLTSPG